MAQKVVKTGTGPHGTTAISSKEKVRVWMQVVVSLVMLIAGILVLISPNSLFPQPFDESTKKWAAGWVGAVIGYWLS